MKKSVLCLFAAALFLSGCGAWQTVKDGTVNLTKDIFLTQIKQLKLDLIARSAINPDEKGAPLSVVVRIYQLKDNKTFEAASYEDLLNQDKVLLAQDLLDTHQVVLRPKETISLSQPFNADARFVGVVAYYNHPDQEGKWRILLAKKQLSNSKAVAIEFIDSQVQLLNQD